MNDRVNIPLLRKGIEWAEGQARRPPDLCEWEQRVWTSNGKRVNELFGRSADCGTLYCLFGYVATLVEGRDVDIWSDPVPEIARNALGLTESEADKLSSAKNTIEDLRRIAEDIAGEAL